VRRLVTIPISHYCEKARWALERAGLDYREERHVQGVHRVAARRAGGGATVPVLVAPEGVFAESEEIVAYADRQLPAERRLFPDDERERHEVESVSRWLDAGLGPDGRRLMYAHMLDQRELMLRFNNQGVPRWEDRVLSLGWPLASRWGRRELDVKPDTKQTDRRRVIEAFDAVAERLDAGGGYLCCGRFTAADLTFAALAASVLVPPGYGVPLPQPELLPPELRGQIEELREHPAGRRALELFADERPRSAQLPPV
jgi:glutathione S-transferase